MYSFTDRGGRELTLRPEGTAPVVRAYLEQRPGARAAAGQALVRGADVPLRPRPARPLPRALAVRRRVAGLGRPGRRRRGDRAAGGLVRRARAARRPRARAQLDRRRKPAARPTASCWWPTSSASAASSRRSPRRGSTSIRCASSTPRTSATSASSAERPRITDHLCDACAAHFAGVRGFLDARGVAYEVDPELVRGIDYYERTAWEWVIPGGGSQAGTHLRRRALRRPRGADRRQPRARRGLRLRHGARRACAGGGRAKAAAGGARLVRRVRRRGRPAAAARAARAGRARGASQLRQISPGAASRASCGTPSGCGPASSRSAAPVTARVASSGTERPRSRSATSWTTWSGACADT